MSYTVRRTNGTTLVEVADQTINTTDTNLALVGRGAVNYGQSFAENFVKLLENFAHTSAPTKPLMGQLWYDTGASVMKYYDGATWKVFSGSGTGGSTSIPGGGTIGGGVSSGNRAAGSAGIVLTSGAASTTVTVDIAEGRIVSITSPEVILASSLPVQTVIDGQTYVVQARFPSGLKAGVTLATDPAGYLFAGQATSAQYADLAERYAASEALEAGDVVEIGGAAEIQKVRGARSPNVFGVISTKPAFRMNEDAGDDASHPFVALAGRVPVKVVGKVSKGDRLVSSDVPGVAMAMVGVPAAGTVIGRALADKLTDDEGVVEVVVGVN